MHPVKPENYQMIFENIVFIFRIFVTFETVEAATHAQTSLETGDEGWRVVPARRPPQTAGTWAPAPSPRNPQPPKDSKRNLVTYDDIFD